MEENYYKIKEKNIEGGDFMKKTFSILLTALFLLNSLFVSVSFAADAPSWEGVTQNSDGSISVDANSSGTYTFNPASQSAAINFFWELPNKKIAAGDDYIFEALSGDTLVAKVIFTAESNAFKSSYAIKGGTIVSRDTAFQNQSGNMRITIDKTSKTYMARNYNGSWAIETILASGLCVNDFESIDTLKITCGAQGLKIKNVSAGVPSNFGLQNSGYVKSYNFEDRTIGTSVTGIYDFSRGSNASAGTIIADPTDSSNKVLKVNGNMAQLRLTEKGVGLTGNIFFEQRVYFPTTLSVHFPEIVQFGGNGVDGYRKIIDSLQTGTIFGLDIDGKSGPKFRNTKFADHNKWIDLLYLIDVPNKKVKLFTDGKPFEADGKTEFPLGNVDFINNLQYYITTAGSGAEFYVDDISIGMYAPFTYTGDGLTFSEENKSVTGISESDTAESLLNKITLSDPKATAVLKDYSGNEKKSGELSVGDYIVLTDASGNYSLTFNLTELFGLNIKSSFADFNISSKTVTLKSGYTLSELTSGIVSQKAYEISKDTQGEIVSGDIITITLDGVALQFKAVISDDDGDYRLNWNFENKTLAQNGSTNIPGNPSSSTVGIFTEANGNNALILSTDGYTGNARELIYSRYNLNSALTGVFNAEFDVLVSSFTEADGFEAEFPFYNQTDYGVGGAANPIIYVGINDSGYITAKSTADRTVLTFTDEKITANTWAHISVVNRGDGKFDICLNGKKLNSEPIEYSYLQGSEGPVINRFQPAFYTRAENGTQNLSRTVLLDNFKVGEVKPEISKISYILSDGTAYAKNTQIPANLKTVSLKLDASHGTYSYSDTALQKSVKVYNENGEEILYTGAFNAQTNSFNMTFDKIKDNTSYRIVVTDLKTDYESASYNAEFAFDIVKGEVTASIESAHEYGEIYAIYSVTNETSEPVDIMLALAVYKNGKIIGFDMKNVTLASGTSISEDDGVLALEAPESFTEYKAFVWNAKTLTPYVNVQ